MTIMHNQTGANMSSFAMMAKTKSMALSAISAETDTSLPAHMKLMTAKMIALQKTNSLPFNRGKPTSAQTSQIGSKSQTAYG